MTLSSKTPKEIKYPNQPLTEVDCEVRFYGEPVIEARRHEFFEEVRDQYPLVYVPPYKDGVHTALQHFRFEKEDLSAGVSLALNSFGYFQRDYQGATQYKKEVARLFEIANSIFSIKNYSRLGWRYINTMPFVREDSLIPLSRFFNGPPSFFAIDSYSYERIDFKATTRFEDVSVSVKLESDTGLGDKNEVLYFDIDVYRSDLKAIGFTADEVPKMIDKLHCVARNYFDSSITDEYVEYLKDDAI